MYNNSVRKGGAKVLDIIKDVLEIVTMLLAIVVTIKDIRRKR